MSSFKSSKFHGSRQFSQRPKVSGSRPTSRAGVAEGDTVQDQRRKRVRKACERCKIKKIKCDAGALCKRCKKDSMICVPSSKRRPKSDSIPRAYAEILETTNFALTATLEMLYVMLRNGDTWELDEPELNDHGIPVIHDVARILGCIKGPQDEFWPYLGDLSDLHRVEVKTCFSQPGSRDDKHMLLSGVRRSSSEYSRFRSPLQDSEATSGLMKAAIDNSLIQEEDYLASQKYSVPEHKESQQKPSIILPDVIMQEIQFDESNSPFFPMDPLDSSPYVFSELEIGIFKTRDITNALTSEIPLKDIDWRFCSDLLPSESI